MKNDVNRMVVIIVAGLLILFMLLVLLTLFGAPGVLPPALAAIIVGLNAGGKIATVILAVLVIIGCFWAIYKELQPVLGPDRIVPLHQDEQGQVTVHTTGINRLIQYIAREQPELLEVTPDATMTPLGINIHCRIALRSNVQVETVKTAFSSRIRQEIQRHLDVAIADIGILTDIRPAPEEQERTAVEPRPPHRQLQ